MVGELHAATVGVGEILRIKANDPFRRSGQEIVITAVNSHGVGYRYIGAFGGSGMMSWADLQERCEITPKTEPF